VGPGTFLDKEMQGFTPHLSQRCCRILIATPSTSFVE